jgi:uncharacterized membrane protein (UPF0127 family)
MKACKIVSIFLSAFVLTNMLLAQKELHSKGKLSHLRKVPLSQYQKATLNIASKRHLHLWVAGTPAKAEDGMSFLLDNEVKVNEGMLFVLNSPRQPVIWMRYVYMPLDVAFVDVNMKIINIEKMFVPHGVNKHKFERMSFQQYVASMYPNPPFYTSKRLAKYVLILKRGVFSKLNLKAGSKLDLPKGLVGY